MIGVISKSIHEWMGQYGITDPEQIKMICPFSLKNFPTSYDDFSLDNSITVAIFPMPVSPSIEDCVKRLRPALKQNTNAGKVAVNDYIIKIMAMLPEWVVPYASSIFSRKNHICFTNLPIKQNKAKFFGNVMEKVGGFNYMSPIGNLYIICLTYNGTLRLTLSTKESLKWDPKILIEKIENTLTECQG